MSMTPKEREGLLDCLKILCNGAGPGMELHLRRRIREIEAEAKEVVPTEPGRRTETGSVSVASPGATQPEPAPGAPSPLQDFVDAHKKWADAMFPDETTAGKLTHLKKEIDEVLSAPTDLSEWADCGMLLFNALSHQGFTVQQLLDAMNAKFAIVQTRKKWVKTEDGDYQSVKAPSAQPVQPTDEQRAREVARAYPHLIPHIADLAVTIRQEERWDTAQRCAEIAETAYPEGRKSWRTASAACKAAACDIRREFGLAEGV